MSEALRERGWFESKWMERTVLVVTVVIDLVLSAGVVGCFFYLLLLLASLLSAKLSAIDSSWPQN